MKCIFLCLLLSVSISVFLESNVVTANPVNNLTETCQNIPNAVSSGNDCVCKIGFRGPESFKPDDKGVHCIDIDECKNINICGENTICFNTIGSYQCFKCKQGYHVVNGKCQDINECLKEDTCGSKFDCVNSIGSYSCMCKSGYTNHNNSHCIDVDECKEGKDNCNEIAACKNNQGSFCCFCPSGYTGSGVGTNGCLDIDECNNTMMCGDDAICTNTIGSYQCSKCDKGHKSVNGFCDDIDECVNVLICGEYSICENTIGSYNCSKCDKGYRNVNGRCEDEDECSTGKAQCHEFATCINNIGSFQCLCDQGYTGNGEGDDGCKGNTSGPDVKDLSPETEF